LNNIPGKRSKQSMKNACKNDRNLVYCLRKEFPVMRDTIIRVLVCIILFALCNVCPAKIIYVDDDAPGANNGTSWADAYQFLQDALADAYDSDKPVEIRVAWGVYTPDKGAGFSAGSIDASFLLINGMTIEGGYAGISSPDANARDFELYETILSGDLLGNDVELTDPCDLLSDITRLDNSYNVVTVEFTDSTSRLDGLTITAGFGRGGGLYINQAEPVITNCTFRNNAAFDGGAIYIYNSSPTLKDCVFIANQVTNRGGAIYSSQSTPVLSDCIFNINRANQRGGGIFNKQSNPNIIRCSFSGNQANTAGGGICNESNTGLIIADCIFTANASLSGGGLYNDHEDNAVLINCTITSNLSLEGGGMQNLSSKMTLTGCLFSGNWAAFNGSSLFNIDDKTSISNCTFTGNMCDLSEDTILFTSDHDFPPDADIELFPSDAEFVNCIIWNGENPIWNDDHSKIVITYSDVQGGWEGMGNFDEDPLFAQPGHWADVDDPKTIVGSDLFNLDMIWIGGDYHLKSQAGRYDPNSHGWILDDVTSPCIDSGDPNSPVGDELQPNGGIINIGAYGGTAEASMSLLNLMTSNEGQERE
jgi:predicted outer membrane repeat protein